MNSTKINSIYALLMGGFLLIEGVWGLFSPLVFGALTTNSTHAVIHIILGIAGLYFGMKTSGRSYNMVVGIILVAVGLLWFMEGTNPVIVKLLNVNETVAYLNIIIGVPAMLLGVLAARQPVKHSVAILF